MVARYPENLKEALIMSLPNAMTMVLGMVTLNLWIYGALTFEHFLYTVPLMFIVAFSLDFIIVGPLVHRFVSKYNIVKFMPFIRVALMAGILTFVAPIIESGRIISFEMYSRAFPRNYLAALILQICIAMQLGMFVFGRYLASHEMSAKKIT